jgi:hypothetical protein
LQAIRVADDGRVGVEDGLEANPFELRRRPDGLERSLHDAHHLRGPDRKDELSLLDAREVQHVFDEPRLHPCIALDGLQGLRDFLLGDRARSEQIGPSDDGAQRRAQFMAHGREELVLRPIRSRGLAERALTVRRRFLEQLTLEPTKHALGR